MNRRGFIATLTALAGVVLVKIKAPAAMWTPIPGTGNKLTYTQTPDGKYRWINPRAVCPRCGAKPMPGYDTLCMNAGDCPMMRKPY